VNYYQLRLAMSYLYLFKNNSKQYANQILK
jgi:hypothetical protein